MKFKIDYDMVNLVIAKWNENYNQENKDTLCWIDSKGKLVLSFPVYGAYKTERMTMTIVIKNGEMIGNKAGDDVTVDTFGLIKLGPKTWRLDPVLITQVIKAYVILVNVPEPAPWELNSKLEVA